MQDFLFYWELGLFHVLDWSAYDHFLFLVALTLPFSFKELKTVFWLVTLFTIGHTFSLVLSAFEIYNPPEKIIELLIPLTILIAALSNIIRNKKINSSKFLELSFSLFFGLIHGFGFGNYFNQITFPVDSKFNPLLGFAIGLEFSQLIIVLGILFVNLAIIKWNSFYLSKYRIISSSVIIGFSISMILNML
ncbi:MAG: HupE/UreJ family protein [Flavobacteriales bacterium]|jgi:hypothetical protein|tara:strand:+ start:5557 stop:6129 length:573 start_codon:yes stop_codon:yes gene_type:complete